MHTHGKQQPSVALILVDIQNDFLEGGSLAVPEASAIMPVVLKLINETKDCLIVATQDWHPPNHVSFAANHHPSKKPFEQVDIAYNGLEHSQTLWPAHCVQGSKGAELSSLLPLDKIQHVIKKGLNPQVDSYSGFADNKYHEITALAKILYQHFVDTIIVVGLAADYCVKMTCLDGVKFGFKTILVKQGTRPVVPDDFETTLEELQSRGVQVVNINDTSFAERYL
ncbi:Isochorismatase-like protein [Dichotomocladium elegans]|nr:Isochorismatase-like protein [Dichotomocladium elegans]